MARVLASDMQHLNAPSQAQMEATVKSTFARHEAILVKQTSRGCFWELFGCEARSEFKVSAMTRDDLDPGCYGMKVKEGKMNQPNFLYAIEKSSFLARCCWRDGRAWNMAVSEGGEPGGQPIVNFDKPCGFPLVFEVPYFHVAFPCCCALPTETTTFPDGEPIGSVSRYKCVCSFVPELEYSEHGQPVYVLKPETCCGGCCISCNPFTCKGCGMLPFYFHEPGTMKVVGGEYDGPNTPQIRKVWSGFAKECCTTADTFAVFYPQGIDANRKAGILGLTFLLDFSIFERQGQAQA